MNALFYVIVVIVSIISIIVIANGVYRENELKDLNTECVKANAIFIKTFDGYQCLKIEIKGH